MSAFLGHTINPRNGRPEPHVLWPLLATFASTFWGLGAAMLGLAVFLDVQLRMPDYLPAFLSAAATFGVIGLVPFSLLRRRKRRYREAVRVYEAALARAAGQL